MKMRLPSIHLSFCAPGLAAASAIILLLPGCAHRADVRPSQSTGDVEYEYFIPQDSKRYELSSEENFEAPSLIWQTYPEYPESLIHAEAPEVAITARLVVNELGGVDRVIFEDADHDEGEQLYMESIRKAVTSWKFTPLVIIHVMKPGGATAVTERVAKPCSLWYQFRFQVKNGQPETSVDLKPSQ